MCRSSPSLVVRPIMQKDRRCGFLLVPELTGTTADHRGGGVRSVSERMVDLVSLLFILLSLLSQPTWAASNESFWGQITDETGPYLENLAKGGSMAAAAVILVLALFMTYSGKRFFKLFLGTAGFLTFGMLGLALVVLLEDVLIPPEHQTAAMFIVGLGCGLIGSWICISLWEVGVLCASAYGGFSLARYILMLDNSHLVTNQVTSEVFTGLAVVASLALGWYFSDSILIFATAIGGGVTAVFAADVYLDYGFNQALLHSYEGLEWEAPFIVELTAVVVLVVTGLVVQFLKTNRSGFP